MSTWLGMPIMSSSATRKIGVDMGNLIVGFILGVAACTVGFAGIAKIADYGVVKMQQIVKETAK